MASYQYKTHSKTYALRTHFKKNMSKRFNLQLNRFELKELHSIFNKSARFIMKDTNMKHWYYLTYKCNNLVILYDTSRKEFITVYTMRMFILSCDAKNIPFYPQDYI